MKSNNTLSLFFFMVFFHVAITSDNCVGSNPNDPFLNSGLVTRDYYLTSVAFFPTGSGGSLDPIDLTRLPFAPNFLSNPSSAAEHAGERAVASDAPPPKLDWSLCFLMTILAILSMQDNT